MESEKKVRRPRIGENKGVSREGNTGRYEKIEYNRRDDNAADMDGKPDVNYNSERPSYNKPRYNQNNYNSYNNNNNEVGERNYNTTNRPYNNNRNNNSYGNNNRNDYSNNRGNYNKPRYNNDRPYGNTEGGERPYAPRPYNTANRSSYGNNNGGSRPYNNRPSGNNRGGYNNNRGGFNNRNGYNNNRGGFNRNNEQTRFTPRPRRIEYEQPEVDMNAPIRLNKYMANAGICSRREADEYIQQGLVKVNGEVVTELGTKITRNDMVTYQDKVVTLESKIYVLLNKPKDCVTTSDDPQGRLTVMDIVRNACTERIYPVGRLDRNTTGVLLLTNDGDLASKLTHPKFVKKKIYHVWTDKDVSEEDMQRIADGIELEDGPIHADAVSYATDTDKNQIGIEIHSGRNRIVRRIFEAMGYHIVKLDRVYFAGLTKKNLQRGRWRYLTQQEVNMLHMGAFE